MPNLPSQTHQYLNNKHSALQLSFIFAATDTLDFRSTHGLNGNAGLRSEATTMDWYLLIYLLVSVRRKHENEYCFVSL